MHGLAGIVLAEVLLKVLWINLRISISQYIGDFWTVSLSACVLFYNMENRTLQ